MFKKTWLVLTLLATIGFSVISSTASALNYTATVTPPGNPTWSGQGWLWQTGWNPLTANWPAHGYARWSPYVGNGFAGWRTDFCTTRTPPVEGAIYVYSGPNFTGDCAILMGDAIASGPTHTGGFIFNSDWMQASGLFASWTSSGVAHDVRIKSFTVLPFVHLLVCDGPYQIASTCTATDTYGPLNVPAIGPGTAWPLTDIASIQIGFFR